MALNTSHALLVKEVLAVLTSSSLQALATTASNNRILPDNDDEAVEIILMYTENLAKFFSYRRITVQVLFEYLQKKNVTVRMGESKPELIEKVKKEWSLLSRSAPSRSAPSRSAPSRSASSQSAPSQQPAATDINVRIDASTTGLNASIDLNLATAGTNVSVEVTNQAGGGGGGGGSLRSDVFVREFCKWFYAMLNRLQPDAADSVGDILDPDTFLSNATIYMYLYGAQNVERRGNGQHEVYELLKGVCTSYRLSFVPQLDTGVQAQMTPHGLLLLHCCGVLHQGAAMVGVFEQEFGLVKCPKGFWKIMMTKINLKQGQSTASLPALPQGPVFEVPT